MHWDRFLIEGDILFNSMVANYKEMFNPNMTVKHYCIRDEGAFDSGSKEVSNQYDDEIQKELVPWIHSEYESGRLFTKTLWKPFRDRGTLDLMTLGYKKLFTFKHYYFRVVLESDCFPEECKYCDGNTDNVHFELIIYGWKDEKYEKLQPDNRSIPINNMLPERYWRGI